MKKIINYLKKDIKINYKHYIIMLVFLMLFLIKFDYYVFSPGGLIELTDRIEVENAYDSQGSFNLTYVTARDGNIPNILLSYIIPTWDLVDMDEMRVENENQKEIEERDKIYLKQTSYDAIIAVYKEANVDYSIDKIDVSVTYVYDDSNNDLKVGDIIKSINGVEITDFNKLVEEVAKYKENDKINIKVLRKDKEVDCYAILYKSEDRIIIGISLAELKTVSSKYNINYIFEDNESGSSRGLMCALEIYNKITEFDLTKGKIIAGTGSIDENGKVGPISGVKYKIRGAVKKGASVFIVPTENYEEALNEIKKNNYDIILIEADNLHNVIEKLMNL